MPIVTIVYHSLSDHTTRLAEAVEQGAASVSTNISSNAELFFASGTHGLTPLSSHYISEVGASEM